MPLSAREEFDPLVQEICEFIKPILSWPPCVNELMILAVVLILFAGYVHR